MTISIHQRKVMILAAGQGERMKPLTLNCPKPLIQVAGRSMIDRILDHLDNIHIQHIVINTFYKGQMLIDHLDHDSRIIFSQENELLDTGGGILKALPLLGDEAFFVLNGDVVWFNSENLNRLHELWDDHIMDNLLLLIPRDQALGYDGPGDFFMEPSGHLRRRHQDESYAPYVYAGVHMIHPRLFNKAPSSIFSLNRLWDRAIETKRLFGMLHQGEWFHIGTPQALSFFEPKIAAIEKRI